MSNEVLPPASDWVTIGSGHPFPAPALMPVCAEPCVSKTCRAKPLSTLAFGGAQRNVACLRKVAHETVILVQTALRKQTDHVAVWSRKLAAAIQWQHAPIPVAVGAVCLRRVTVRAMRLYRRRCGCSVIIPTVMNGRANEQQSQNTRNRILIRHLSRGRRWGNCAQRQSHGQNSGGHRL